MSAAAGCGPRPAAAATNNNCNMNKLKIYNQMRMNALRKKRREQQEKKAKIKVLMRRGILKKHLEESLTQTQFLKSHFRTADMPDTPQVPPAKKVTFSKTVTILSTRQLADEFDKSLQLDKAGN